MDGNAEVRSFRPNLPALLIDGVSLGLEITDFGQRQFGDPFVFLTAHRDVAPGCAGQGFLAAAVSDDFIAQDGAATEIGPQQAAPVLRQRFALRAAQREPDAVADETQQAFAGCR